MKRMEWAALLAVLLLPGALFAQIGMSLKLNRSNYMQFEPVLACVSLRNDTGRALVFGDDPRLQGFLLFEVTDNGGRQVARRAGKDISVNGLVLRPGEIKHMVIPISQYYNLDKNGSYRVHAYISHSMLPHEYKSNDVKIMIEPGVEVWKRNVGVPEVTKEAQDKMIRERTYSIRILMENSAKIYYLVIEDSRDVYAVLRIGKQYGIEQYKVDIDMLSRIHLLMPITSKVFQYLTFELDGTNTANKFLKTDRTIPSLLRDPESGRVFVAGGSPAVAGVDFKDPGAGKVSAFDLSRTSELEDLSKRPHQEPGQPPRDGGLVDLGGFK